MNLPKEQGRILTVLAIDGLFMPTWQVAKHTTYLREMEVQGLVERRVTPGAHSWRITIAGREALAKETA